MTLYKYTNRFNVNRKKKLNFNMSHVFIARQLIKYATYFMRMNIINLSQSVLNMLVHIQNSF